MQKVTKAPKATLDSYWSTMTARYLYHEKEIVHREVFYQIWWDNVKAVLHGFPKMFQVWGTKHVSHFCGTNRQLARIAPSIENVCPSCGQKDESMKHITRRKDSRRLEMFTLSIGIIIKFLVHMKTDPELIRMIKLYLHEQGEKTMNSIYRRA